MFFVLLPHQAELEEVVGEGEDEDALTVSSPSAATAESSAAGTPESPPPQVQHTAKHLRGWKQTTNFTVSY